MFSDDWTSSCRGKFATRALTHAWANIYIALWATCRSNDIYPSEIKFQQVWDYISEEMAFNVGQKCGHLVAVAFVLLYVTSTAASCPQGCQCFHDRDGYIADCYGQSSLTSIPAGLPADTAILWVSLLFGLFVLRGFENRLVISS